MAERVPIQPMARLQLLVPDELKAEIEAFAREHSMSVNEAARVLVWRGLAASDKDFTASALLDEFAHIIKDLEKRAGPRPRPST